MNRSPTALLHGRPPRARLGGAAPVALARTSPFVRAVISWGVREGGASLSQAAAASTLAADIALVLRSRLSGLLLQILDAGNELGIAEDVRPGLRKHMMKMITHARAVETAAAPALEALERSGINMVVMKGPAVARFHSSPDVRPFTDIDLLVPPNQFRRALGVLDHLGYRRPAATLQPWPWFDRVCIEGVNVGAGPCQSIDLHHHVAPWALTQRFDARALLERSAVAEVSGRVLRVPTAGDCMVIALLHVVNDLWKGDASLLSWRDIVVLSKVLGTDGIDRSFDDAGLGWMAEIARATLDVLLTRQAAASTHFDRSVGRHRRRLDALGWSSDTFASRHPIGWAARLPAPRALAFVAGHAVPSATYARGKHGGYLRYWAASVESLQWALRGVDYRRTSLPGAGDAPSKRARVGK